MPTITRSTFVNEYVPGLVGVMIDRFDLFNRDTAQWQKICKVETSNKQKEERGYRSGVNVLLHKPEGTPIPYDTPIGGPTKVSVHKTYALGIRITEEAIDDNLYKDMSNMSKDLGESAGETPEIYVARMINNAGATTYHTAMDTLALASASHTRLNGTTYSNLATSADLTYESFWANAILLENQYDHRGRRVQMKLGSILFPPQLSRKAIELFDSPDRPDTTNRSISAVAKKYGSGVKRIPWAYMTDADMWVLIGDKHDLVFYNRTNTKFAKEGDFETGDMRFKVQRRFSVEMGDPRGLYFNIP